jgi:hypothetical protein
MLQPSIKQKNLISILSEAYPQARYLTTPVSWKDLQRKKLETEVLGIYKKLGGVAETPLIHSENFSIELENIVLELDEERNFNRYRAQTLESTLYEQMPKFPLEKYRSYCRNFESECLKSASFGSYWTNEESEKQFGKAGEKGELHKEGAPAWKQKAFNDFLHDITPLVLPIKLLRISIWDNLLISGKMFRLGDLLLTSKNEVRIAVFKHLDRRIKEVL